MKDAFNKKLSEMVGKMDEKVLQARLNAAMDMLKKGNTDELAKKISKVDKEELLSKIDELDTSKINDMNIDMNEVKQKINAADFDKLSKLIGEHGDEIVNKLKSLLEKK